MTEHELVGQIRRDLWAIRDHYDEAIEPARRAAGSYVTSSKEPPLPIGAHVLDVRVEAFRDLHYWCSFILENMRGADDTELATRVVLTVEGMSSFIETWVGKIVSDFPDDATNLAREASKHARGLRGIIQETGARRFPIGGCPEHGTSDMGERIPCPGELRAVLRKDDDLLPSEITCSLDVEHRWPAREWLLLGRRITQEMSA